jgi:hypothetical protein
MATTFNGAHIWRPGGVYHGAVQMTPAPGRPAPRPVPADSALVEDYRTIDGKAETGLMTVTKASLELMANVRGWPADLVGQARAAMSYPVPAAAAAAKPQLLTPASPAVQVTTSTAPSKLPLFIAVTAASIIATFVFWLQSRRKSE